MTLMTLTTLKTLLPLIDLIFPRLLQKIIHARQLIGKSTSGERDARAWLSGHVLHRRQITYRR